MLAALHRAPLHPALAGLLRTAAAKRDGRDTGSSGSGADVDIVILSDANTVRLLLPVFHTIATCCWTTERTHATSQWTSTCQSEFQSTCPVFVH